MIRTLKWRIPISRNWFSSKTILACLKFPVCSTDCKPNTYGSLYQRLNLFSRFYCAVSFSYILDIFKTFITHDLDFKFSLLQPFTDKTIYTEIYSIFTERRTTFFKKLFREISTNLISWLARQKSGTWSKLAESELADCYKKNLKNRWRETRGWSLER